MDLGPVDFQTKSGGVSHNWRIFLVPPDFVTLLLQKNGGVFMNKGLP